MPFLAVPPTRVSNRWIIVGLWLFLYASFALLSPPLLNGVDSLHAEVAREMIVRGDPVTLYADGIRYLEQAPLLYWSMAASMRVFGVGTAAARLPLAVYALLLFLLVEHFARRVFRSARAGLYAGASLLLSAGIFLFTRIQIPDAIGCLWLTAAIFCFWLTESGQGEYSGRAPLLPCIGFAVACALSILTVGPVGLAFAAGTVLLYLLFTRGVRGALRRIGQFHLTASTITLLVVAAPWHALAAGADSIGGHPAGLIHPGPLLPWFWRGWQVGQPAVGNAHGWAWFHFMWEHLLRYLNLRVPRDYDTVSLLLFWGLILVWMLPWSAFLFKAMRAVPWGAAWSRKPPDAEGQVLLLLAIAALLPVLSFSLSTRVYSVLPSLPFFAMLIARWLDREAIEAESLAIPAPLPLAGQRIATFLLVCAAAATMVCAVLLLHPKAASPTTDLTLLLRHNPGSYALSFGSLLQLNAQALSVFRHPLSLAGAACFLGAFGNWHARRNFDPHRGNVALAIGTLGFLTAAHMCLTIISPVLSSQRLAAAIAPQLRASDLIVINDEFQAGSTLAFYLGRDDIHILHGHSSSFWDGSFFIDAPQIFETDESIQRKWSGPVRIFVWTDPTKLPALPSKAYVIAEGEDKEIVSNRQGQY
jgi:4-amino-4-deoxy-L-arabinose transferase-like glycosyltransferase